MVWSGRLGDPARPVAQAPAGGRGVRSERAICGWTSGLAPEAGTRRRLLQHDVATQYRLEVGRPPSRQRRAPASGRRSSIESACGPSARGRAARARAGRCACGVRERQCGWRTYGCHDRAKLGIKRKHCGLRGFSGSWGAGVKFLWHVTRTKVVLNRLGLTAGFSPVSQLIQVSHLIFTSFFPLSQLSQVSHLILPLESAESGEPPHFYLILPLESAESGEPPHSSP